MSKQLKGVLKLTRINEYVWFVIVTTLVGAATAGGEFGWALIGALIANELSVGFAFMINDVEDADDDALNPAKINRNPVSAGLLTRREANLASYGTALIAGVIYATLSPAALIVGVISLIVGWIYSWGPVRLKSKPIVDLLSHVMMLAGFQFLAGHFTFANQLGGSWFFPFLFLVSISGYGELYNELRDYEGDLKAGLKHTAAVIGHRAATLLMNTLLILGIVGALYTIFFMQILPGWVIGLLVAVFAVLFLRPMLNARRAGAHGSVEAQAPFQVPIQIAAAIALSAWFVVVWLDKVL
ncbi:MAG TPA: UbiA family prenyltransferase [Anaerolineae bacterium]|nr:UbiA family prenyltransferase [Anaerolineae bacterium]